MYGIDVGLDYKKLNELAALVQGLSEVRVPECRPFIGEGAYTIESGIVTGWYRNVFENNPTTLFPVHPNFVGHEKPRIFMGRKSGVYNIAIWAEKLGIELNEDEVLTTLQEIKLKRHDLKRVLNETEFLEVVEDVKNRYS